MCVALAPHLMAMNERGKAYPKTTPIEWSRPDGEIIYHCPVRALSVTPVQELRNRTVDPERGVAAD